LKVVFTQPGPQTDMVKIRVGVGFCIAGCTEVLFYSSVILDVPPASEKTIFFGTVIDAWQLPLVDVGPAGEDAGKGGKYLVLPPGYNKLVLLGYLVYRPKTFHLYVALRPVSIKGGTLQDAVAYSKQLKADNTQTQEETPRCVRPFLRRC
jgi:hypothetical protein